MLETVSAEAHYDLAKAKLASSGISQEVAESLLLRILDPQETSALGENFAQVASIQIPYFDPAGKPTEFYRVRYLGAPAGFAGLVAKPQRYAQPKGSLNEVYLPPIYKRPWKEVFKDATQEIIITEGEFKAACACAHGLACIGLGGVDVWRAGKRGIDLLPTLREVEWSGRSVAIVFDSDAATNPGVTAAQRRLAAKITELGGKPLLVALPPGAGGAKQGLDDFLVAGGDFNAILAEAEPYPEAEALWGLNEEVIYITDPGLVVVQKTGQRISPTAFERHTYANRHYNEITIKNGAVSMKRKPLAPRWIAWEKRFALRKLTYAPGHPKVFDDQCNMWPGLAVDPKKGDVSPWLWLLGFLFPTGKEAERAWFERWCAFPFQHPGVKQYTASLLWGVTTGTGKTLVGYTLAKLYGPNAIEIKNKDLRGGFNEWAENKQFVIGDEISGAEARIDADYLKGLITQEHMRVNVKYVPSFTIPDCISYLFTSNHPDALFLEDFDRRFFVHEVVGAAAERSFYDRYDKWYRSVEGQRALLYHLLHLDLGDYNPRAEAPTTGAKASMIRDAKSDLGMWVLHLKENPERVLLPLGPEAADKCQIFTPKQLLHCYDPEGKTRVTANGLGRELKRAGFRTASLDTPVRVPVMGLQRFWAVRNINYWHSIAKPKQVAEHWNEFFGMGKEKFE